MVGQETQRHIVEIVRRHMPLAHYRVFLFGSRVTGAATPRSDYDIGLEAAEPVPGGALAKMALDLEDLPILQKVEVIDFARVSKEFSAEAGKRRQILYEQ